MIYLSNPLLLHIGYCQLFTILDSDAMGRSLCMKVFQPRIIYLGRFPEEEAFLGEKVGDLALADTLGPLIVLWLDRDLSMQEGGTRVAERDESRAALLGTSLLRPQGRTYSGAGLVALKAEGASD